MNKEEVKIVVVGVGSIGSRHINNLLSLGFMDIELVTKRSIFPETWPRFKTHDSVQNAVKSKSFTHALICTPTAQHIKDLQEVIKFEINSIFLEKPISHNAEGLDDIVRNLGKDQKIWLGYDLRFDPGLLLVKSLIQEGKIGRILSVNAFVGQFLPNWRPHEDYRKGSSALKAKGGGVLLDLVHEFDYLYWLLGKVKSIASLYQNTGVLEIETEDMADVLLSFESGIQGSLHLDYHQRKLIRYCIFTGSKGSIKWDLSEKKVSLTLENEQSRIWDFSKEERNNRFIQIMESFMGLKEKNPLATFEEGIESLKMVLAAKKSSETHTFVSIE